LLPEAAGRGLPADRADAGFDGSHPRPPDGGSAVVLQFHLSPIDAGDHLRACPRGDDVAAPECLVRLEGGVDRPACGLTGAIRHPALSEDVGDGRGTIGEPPGADCVVQCGFARSEGVHLRRRVRAGRRAGARVQGQIGRVAQVAEGKEVAVATTDADCPVTKTPRDGSRRGLHEAPPPSFDNGVCEGFGPRCADDVTVDTVQPPGWEGIVTRRLWHRSEFGVTAPPAEQYLKEAGKPVAFGRMDEGTADGHRPEAEHESGENRAYQTSSDAARRPTTGQHGGDGPEDGSPAPQITLHGSPAPSRRMRRRLRPAAESRATAVNNLFMGIGGNDRNFAQFNDLV